MLSPGWVFFFFLAVLVHTKHARGYQNVFIFLLCTT